MSAAFCLFPAHWLQIGYKGVRLSGGQAYANLLVFPPYLKKVYRLLDWLGQNHV